MPTVATASSRGVRDFYKVYGNRLEMNGNTSKNGRFPNGAQIRISVRARGPAALPELPVTRRLIAASACAELHSFSHSIKRLALLRDRRG